MKKVSGRLANLTPEQREKLLKKLREQKKEQGSAVGNASLDLKNFRAPADQQVLSFSQQRLWFLNQLGGGQAAYNIPASLKISGKLNIASLEKSFQFVVNRHESLRSIFITEHGLPRVKILENQIFKLARTDLSAVSKAELSSRIKEISHAEACKPFILDKGPLLRVHLLTLGNNDYHLLICMHHIISDAWSMRVLVKEVSLAYNQYLNNQVPQLPRNELRYVDYSAWQRQRLASDMYKNQAEFWQASLKEVEPLNFPFDKPRPVEQSYIGKQIVFELSESLSNKLRLIARAENKTLFALLLAAWQVFLYRYSGQKDICIGTPVANRPHSELENLIGFFVNTLPIRAKIDGDKTFIEFLNQVQVNALGAFANPDIPFEKMIDDLHLERDLSQSPVFQSMFSFQNDAVEEGLDFENLAVNLTPIHTQTAKFDLSLDVVDQKKSIKLSLEYNSDLLLDKSAEFIKANLETLLESIALDASLKLFEFNCLHESFVKIQLQTLNKTEVSYEKFKSIASQFESQVNQSPQSLALKYNEVELSYAQLNFLANKLAHKLIEKGVSEKSTVAILLDRDESFVVAILAVVKAGAHYLPLDPAFPTQCLNECLFQENNPFLLTKKSLADSLNIECYEREHLFIDTDLSWQRQKESNPEQTINSESIIYKIFAHDPSADFLNAIKISPQKYVAASHRSLSNLVAWYHGQVQDKDQEKQGKGIKSKYLLSSSPASESAQKNIFTPLLNGNALVLPSATKENSKGRASAIESSENILSTIVKEKISYLNCSTAEFYDLLALKNSHEKLLSLKYLFLNGGQVQVGKFQEWYQQSACRIIHCYSLSGCTDIISAYSLEKIEDSRCIGKPIQNVKLFLLDDYLQLVPFGVYGKLYVGGDALGRVYDGQDKLDKHQFIDNPIPGETGKLYGSGKLARYLPNGEFELLSIDAQPIKIRGYQVDTCRIINALLADPDIINAAVIFNQKNSAKPCLAAFIVLKKGINFQQDALQQHMKNCLPDFMLPSLYFQLESLPLTFHKNLDESALVYFLEVFSKQESYWLERLQDVPVLQLPNTRSHFLKDDYQLVKTERIERFYFVFSDELRNQLIHYTQEHSVSLLAVLMSIYQVLLSRYCNQYDFSVGTIVPNESQFKNFLSNLDKNVALRSVINEENNFEDLLKVVDCSLAEAFQNSDIPFEGIVEKLKFSKELTSSIFQTALLVHEAVESSDVDDAREDGIRHCDLLLDINAGSKVFSAHFSYESLVFDQEMIQQLANHFQQLAIGLLSEPQVNVEQVNYLKASEKTKIIALAQGEKTVYPHYQNVPEFLKALDAKHQENKALLFQILGNEESLSYRALHEQSDKLALYLQTLGLTAQAPVALCLDRSVDMVIGLLAVIKAGSPYLPLDPELPKERLVFMLEDSAAQFVLCHNDTARRFEEFSGLINLQNSEVQIAIDTCKGELINAAKEDDLFNIIYTSGSTGKPKGVMVTHKGILNRIQWMQEEYRLKPKDRVLQKTTYSFDVSVWEFIWPLSVGAGLVLAKPGGHKDPVYLNELIKEAGITHCHFVPSMLLSWLDMTTQTLHSLQKVFCSGEALSREAVNQFYKTFPNCELHNLYGPTEAAIDVSYWHCEKAFDEQRLVPIGKPVSNTQLYVFDKYQQFVALGIVGELYIAGVQLARGYLNREDLNKTTFIERAIDGLGEERFYKTGDLVRQTKEGVIEYLGRIDHQVKIRGYRIELGEIESCLQSMDIIALSVVVAVEVNNSQKLVAYLSLLDKSLTNEDEIKQGIKQYLTQHLPAYMVPSVIVILDTMPLLENGKINRKLLPKLELSSMQSSEYIAATSELEAQLQTIWQAVLGLENVSTRDNFFDLGGDSILSIQIISAARRENIILSPSQIFRHPTIAELAQLASVDKNIVQAEQGLVTGKFVCSPIQQWFFANYYEKNKQAAQHFNQSVLLELKLPINFETLKILAASIIEQHDVLNTSFIFNDGIWQQAHGESSLTPMAIENLLSEGHIQVKEDMDREESFYQNLLKAQSSLNIEEGRLLHFLLLNELVLGELRQSLYIVAHHLVVDGISWRVIMEDIDQMLTTSRVQEKQGSELLLEHCQAVLSEKTLSFQQWTQKLATLSSTNLLDEDRKYWFNEIEKLNNYQSPLVKNILQDKVLYKNQKRIGFSVSKALTDKFLKQANRSFKSEANDILLCALMDSLFGTQSDASQETSPIQPQLSISLEAHGRDLSDKLFEHLSMPDVSRTLGWFTTLFPLLLTQNERALTWGEKLKDIKEQIRKIPNKGLGFGLLAQYDANNEFSLSAKEIKPDISFNYLGQFGSENSSKNFVVNTHIRHIKHGDYLDQSPLLERAHSLDIVIFVSDGCLQCDFLYDHLVYDELQIQSYLQTYQERLEALIQYCCDQSYSSLSPSDLKSLSLSQKEIETIESQYNKPNSLLRDATRQEIETLHGLLPTQAGMLFHTLYQGAQSYESTYFEQFCIQLKGPLEITVLEKSWKILIQSYPSLRSCFHWQFSEFVQVVFKSADFSIEHHALSSENTSQQNFDLASFLENDRKRGFDLSCPPLMRVSLIDISTSQQWLVWTYHHILLDGWSVPLVLNSLFENYAALIEGKEILNQASSIFSYEKYIAWYKNQSGQDNAFWKTELEGFVEPNAIELEPIAFPIEVDAQISESVAQQKHIADESVELSLGLELSQQLREFARSHQLTLNTLVQGAWALLLSQYSGDDDVIFGATVSGRSDQYAGSENIVGMFINTLPLRVRLQEDMSLLTLLNLVQDTQQKITAHQSNSLMEIQKSLGFESESTLFNSILVFENFPVSEKLKQENPWFKVEGFYSYEKTNYPLTISVEPGETLNFRVLFDNKRYRKETMERLLGHMACLLEDFPSSVKKKIFSINYISEAERKALDNWNKTETNYPRDASLVELVEQSVRQSPKQIALKFDDISLTYEHLNKKANQFARYLHEQGAQKGKRVVLFMDRSQELLVSALAVIKTGAAYIPLDPAYPKERLQYMLQDCEPSIILSVLQNKSSLEAALRSSKTQRKIIYVDEQQAEFENYADDNPKLYDALNADDLAYLMYTSGSTGQPKGVCLSHRSIIRLVMNNWYLTLGPKDKVGHICNVCFDASAYEIWGALLNGATLIGFDRETILSEDLFAEKLQREGVTNMLMTTSLFHLYSRHRPEIFDKMRCLLIGGEPLHPDAARRVLNQSRPLHLMNVYGPTENGVLTTVFDTWNLAEGAKNTPVGKPISNSTVYIVNKRNQELPVGVVGELVSGGDGVGLGYWKLDEVTARTFVADPFSKEANARMYRTGDLARRLPDGSFEVLGRMDDQLKIRGFRIEPSEIVARLNAIESVKDAVVVIVESEGHRKYLVAYIVAKEKATLDFMQAKKSLANSLPAHMVPSFFIEISSIPITPNGKLDKAKLPKPKFDEVLRDNYAAPRNETESELVNIWADVLKVGAVGVFDNFFELGGDSIISIQIVSRAKRAGLNISPKLLFEHPTVADLAVHVSTKNQVVHAEQGLVSGEIKLTPIQQWFFEQPLADVDHFNQSLLFDVEEFLTIQNITPVVSALLKQHDVLRLRFNFMKSEWVQKHDNSARSLASLADILSEQNFSHAEDPYASLLKHAELMQAQLNLTKGPLIKIVLYHLGKQGQKLLIIAHHLIIDGVSWRILLDDLNLAMNQQANNHAIDFGEKTTSYQHWSRTLVEYANSEQALAHQNYWSSVLQEASVAKVLDLKNKRAKQTSFEQKRISFQLDARNSEALLRACHQAFRTEVQDLLLLAFTMALNETELGKSAWIDLEGHGRNALQGSFAEQIDNSKTMGWFTSIYPLLLEVNEQHIAENNLSALIKHIKSTLRAVPEQGVSFAILKYLSADKRFEKLLAEAPASEISFNYLGQINETSQATRLKLDTSYLGADNSRENKAKYALNLAAVFQKTQFEFNLNYDAELFEAEQVETLCHSFIVSLNKIIVHCLNESHFGFTPSDIPYFPLEQQDLDTICADSVQENNGRLQAIYPLSPMQEGMLFHSRLDKSSGMYCEQVSVLFSGNMKVAAMQQAWNDAIASHDILRTSFIWENLPKPLQRVHAKAHIDLQILDWRDESNVDDRLQRFLIEDRQQGFDFSKAPLMRLHYIHWPKPVAGQSLNKTSEKQALGRFIWTYHHILLDGWSMPLLMREVFDRYNVLCESDLKILPNANFSNKHLHDARYENYIEWLYTRSGHTAFDASQQTSKGQSASEQFWLAYLAGFEEPNSLALTKRKNKIPSTVEQGFDKNSSQNPFENQTLQYQELSNTLSEAQTKKLQNLAASHQVTLNTLLQGAWALLLNRYSGEQDIVFGITVSGRPSSINHIESIIGLFINTVPFRVQVNAKSTLDEWLKSILKNQVQLRQFETTPLVDIQAQSHIDGSRALFESILVFENYPLDETLASAPVGLQLEDLQVYEQTNFPLSLIVLPGKALDIRMLFDTQIFEHDTIEQVLRHLKTILLALCDIEDSAQTQLKDIAYLSEQEQQLITQELNDTDSDYPRNDYLQDIVAQQDPNKMALMSEQGNLSFAELEKKAQQLAAYMSSESLGESSVKPGDKVVICLDRSCDLIVAILAILKAGGTYVPLDPGYPEERQRYMLEDTQTRLIISDAENAPLVKHLSSAKSFRNTINFIDINAKQSAIAAANTEHLILLAPYSDNEDVPAAILYTSGSTGQPKGVCLTHRGLSRMVLNTNYMQVSNNDRVAHVSNICFDAASFEIWAALLNGLPLVILERDIMLDLEKFEQHLKAKQVSILLITTALFNLVAKEQVSALESINYLFFGGEACNVGMVKRALEIAKPKHLMHMYGPSENATYATWYEVKAVEADAKTIPIGRAVSNSQVYIMNQQGDLLPTGVAGEIVCAGDGLALGYLNKPEQTQKAFVMRALPGKNPERMYLTGDLGRYLADGNIEILGRIDNQVKIRGHRIEPEEIIARINALPEIKKAYVLVKQDKEDKKFLVAYFVPEQAWIKEQEDKPSRARELKLKLKTQMPDYMVPSFYVEIEELPLTPNGKIDTKALPDAELLQSSSDYQAPENSLEKALVEIWQEVLQHKKIGVYDDFFELGGHSLLATQVHSRIRQQLNIDVPLRTLFELPSIREFSEFCLALEASQALHDTAEGGDDEDFEEGEL